MDISIAGEDIIDILEEPSITNRLAAILRMDNGPELTCRALAQCAAGVVDLVFIPPGEPWKIGYVEVSHSCQHDELLSITMFPNLLHTSVKLTDWHREDNRERRHSSLGYKTPTEYAETCICAKPE